MAEVAATSFTIESTVEKAADVYDAAAVDLSLFLSPSHNDQITLEAGLVDPIDGPVRVGQLIGVVDQYTLNMQQDAMTVTLSGRDLAAELLERQYQKLYLLTPPDPGTEPTTPYTVGQFRASEVAADVVRAAGLTLMWQCRDYALQETFSASGRSIDILRTLVEPWSQVPMFAVDIYVQGTVVIFKPRVLAPAADYTYSVHDARIKELGQYSKRRLPVIGTLRLEGMRSAGVSPKGGGWKILSSSEATEEDSSETTDPAGAVISRVTSKRTYRMPDKILLRSLDQTYAKQGDGDLQLIKEASVTNEWEGSKYNPTGAANQPKQLAQENLNSGIHPQDPSKKFRELERKQVAFSYDQDGFLNLTETRTWSLNLAKKELLESERTSVLLRDISLLETEEVTVTQSPTASGDWYVSNTAIRRSAGLRPGGKKPPPTRSIAAGSALSPITLTVDIDSPLTEPWAKDVRYSNPHMTLDDLHFIAAQFEAASGIWEGQLQFRCVTMPWLKKGVVLHLTGLTGPAPGNTAIPIPPALVLSSKLSLVESSEKPEMVSTVTAIYWTASP